jgi:hypothetical protein
MAVVLRQLSALLLFAALDGCSALIFPHSFKQRHVAPLLSVGGLKMEIKTALSALPCWSDGERVTIKALKKMLSDENPIEDEDEFYDAIDELEEQCWLASQTAKDTADPDNDVLFSAVPSYDVGAEEAAVEVIMRNVENLKRFGVDSADKPLLAPLQSACEQLSLATEGMPAPPLRDDPRLIGDWQLVGTTSEDLVARQGLTGLGAAPFTEPLALFYRFLPTGEVVVKECLEFFGRPVVLNELRGRFGFSEDGELVQEQYSSADMGGQREQDFQSMATYRAVCITSDGKTRLGLIDGKFFIFRKLDEGELEQWLQRRNLPFVGGTVATLNQQDMKVAYPYLGKGGQNEEGAGGETKDDENPGGGRWSLPNFFG